MPECEPILTGKDILPFRILPPKRYISFRPDQFQQAVGEKQYRNPGKLVYRFINRNLVFAADREGRLILNSANALIPRDPEVSSEVLLALLNSSVMNYYFSKTENSLKVLRSHLENLPLPLLEIEEKEILRDMTFALEQGKLEKRELDHYIFSLYHFSESEKKILME